MFLSKVRLDIGNPSARQAIFNCNDMHRNLMRAFEIAEGSAMPRMEESVLYRLIQEKYGRYLLVMSRNRPDWEKLARSGYAAEDVRDISALREVFVEGRTLGFSLLAAPTKKIANGGKNSRRVFLRTREERDDWLARQGEKYGFTLLGAWEAALPVDVFGKKGTAGVVYRAVEFTGVLAIRDASLFWKGYTRGIGAGKAYGLGLMMLARP